MRWFRILCILKWVGVVTCISILALWGWSTQRSIGFHMRSQYGTTEMMLVHGLLTFSQESGSIYVNHPTIYHVDPVAFRVFPEREAYLHVNLGPRMAYSGHLFEAQSILLVPILVVILCTALAFSYDRRMRPRSGDCQSCGYNLTGIDSVCPECGVDSRPQLKDKAQILRMGIFSSSALFLFLFSLLAGFILSRYQPDRLLYLGDKHCVVSIQDHLVVMRGDFRAHVRYVNAEPVSMTYADVSNQENSDDAEFEFGLIGYAMNEDEYEEHVPTESEIVMFAHDRRSLCQGIAWFWRETVTNRAFRTASTAIYQTEATLPLVKISYVPYWRIAGLLSLPGVFLLLRAAFRLVRSQSRSSGGRLTEGSVG